MRPGIRAGLLLGCAGAAALSCNTQGTPKPSQGAESTAAPTTTPAATTPADAPKKPIPARDTDPTPDPITHPCVVSAAQYSTAIDKGKTDCKTDSDCGCYQGGIGRQSGCGGVLNKESLKELTKIADEFRKDGCQHTQQCAPWACQPKCENGQCRK